MRYQLEDLKPDNPLSTLLFQNMRRFQNQGFTRVIFPDQTFVVPSGFRNYLDQYENFKTFNDDIWIVSHPKSGTTWCSEMVWCIQKGVIQTDKHIYDRIPYLECSGLFRRIVMCLNPNYWRNSVELCNEAPRPRILKTHLPFELLPKGLREGGQGRIVYVTRNPYDVCVSYYHFVKFVGGYTGSLKDFVTLFTNNTMIYSPFWGSVKSYWKHRLDPNVLFLTYEEMKRDLRAVIIRTAKFLGKELSEDQIQAMVHHLDFNQLKNNEMVNFDGVFKQKTAIFLGDGTFMREGKVGGFRQVLDDHMLFQIGKMTRDIMKDSDFDFSLIKI